jgi:hypothetical protein
MGGAPLPGAAPPPLDNINELTMTRRSRSRARAIVVGIGSDVDPARGRNGRTKKSGTASRPDPVLQFQFPA